MDYFDFLRSFEEGSNHKIMRLYDGRVQNREELDLMVFVVVGDNRGGPYISHTVPVPAHSQSVVAAPLDMRLVVLLLCFAVAAAQAQRVARVVCYWDGKSFWREGMQPPN